MSGLSVRYLLPLLMLVLAIVPPGRAATPALDTVRVLFQPFASSGPLFVADAEGDFAHQQIRVTWVPFTAQDQAIPVLAQGQLDVGFALVPAFFNAVARGEVLRFVADRGHIAGRNTSGLIMVRRELAGVVKTVADLRGRRIALAGNFGNSAHYWLVKTLAMGNLTFDQVVAVFMPATASVAALESGAVDAALVAPPLTAVAQEKGIAVALLDLADVIPGEHTNLLIYGRTLTVGNRALGVRIMTAYLQGVRRFLQGPTARNVEIIAKYTRTDPDTVRKSAWTAVHPDGYIDINRTRRYQDWLYQMELITVRSPMSSLIDPFFVEQARAILGIPARP